MLPVLIVNTASFADVAHQHGLSLAITSRQPVRRLREERLPVLELMVPDFSTIVKPYRDKKIDYKEYCNRYKRFLDSNKLNIFNRFEEYRNNGIGEITIVGWDTKPSNCHRSIAAEWIRENNLAMIGSRN